MQTPGRRGRSNTLAFLKLRAHGRADIEAGRMVSPAAAFGRAREAVRRAEDGR